MAGTDAFRVEGLIVEVLSDRTCRVKLANGHQLLGFVPGKRKTISPALATGQTATVQMTPYDLSSGRILAVK